MTFCSFIQRGTFSSTVTPQMTRVLPHSIKVEPVAYGAMPFRKRSGRNWFTARPSARKEGTADCDSDITRAMLNVRRVMARFRLSSVCPSETLAQISIHRLRRTFAITHRQNHRRRAANDVAAGEDTKQAGHSVL